MSIELRAVEFESHHETLLSGIDLTIKDGSSILLMGPSGSGKTLLLKIMAGIIPPSRGTVSIDGHDLSRLNDRDLNRVRLDLGYVFQDAALWQNLSVRQNLTLATTHHFPRRPAAEVDATVDRLCRKMGFRENLDQRPALLSAGERKVASIIRSLMLDPRYLFMDEPSGALDSAGSDQLLDLLKEQKSLGKTLIIAGHDEEIASMIADSIIVLDEGRVLAYDTVARLVRTEDARVRRILADVFDLSSTYDTDILDILGSDESDPFG
jgi:ABC-type multidrug transport system ATPase subunit